MSYSRTNRITMMIATVAIVAFLASQIMLAKQPKEAEAKNIETKEVPGGDGPCTPEKVEPFNLIGHALKCLINPPNLDDEHWAALTLFGDTHWLDRKDLPERVQKLLVARRLNYRNWKSRATALRNLASWFREDSEIPTLLALLRDGLNDPHPKVRVAAVDNLDNAFSVITTGFFDPKEKTARARFAKRRNDWADAVIDLTISKGLTDEDEDVVRISWAIVDSKRVKGTSTRLRALDRVLARKLIRRAEDLGYAKELCAKWAKALKAKR